MLEKFNNDKPLDLPFGTNFKAISTANIIQSHIMVGYYLLWSLKDVHDDHGYPMSNRVMMSQGDYLNFILGLIIMFVLMAMFSSFSATTAMTILWLWHLVGFYLRCKSVHRMYIILGVITPLAVLWGICHK